MPVHLCGYVGFCYLATDIIHTMPLYISKCTHSQVVDLRLEGSFLLSSFFVIFSYVQYRVSKL